VKLKRPEKSFNSFLRETDYSKKFGKYNEEDDNCFINSRNFAEIHNSLIQNEKIMIKKPAPATNDHNSSLNIRKEKKREREKEIEREIPNDELVEYTKIQINKHKSNEKDCSYIEKNSKRNIQNSTTIQLIQNSNSKKKLYPITNHNILVNKLNNKFETNKEEYLSRNYFRKRHNSTLKDELAQSVNNFNNYFNPNPDFSKNRMLEKNLLKSIKIENQDKYKPMKKVNKSNNQEYELVNYVNFNGNRMLDRNSFNNSKMNLINAPIYDKNSFESYFKNPKEYSFIKDFSNGRNLKNNFFNQDNNDKFSRNRKPINNLDSGTSRHKDANRMRSNKEMFSIANCDNFCRIDNLIDSNGRSNNKDETIKDMSIIIYDLYDKISSIKSKLDGNI